MKPIIIYINNKDSNKIELTTEQFEKYLTEAYEQGYAEGKSDNTWHYPTLPVYYYGTNTTPSTATPITNPDPYKITCEAHNAIGD